jgi:RNA-directed DNA polymerase
METLQEAYQMAKSNDGAPGIDGVTFDSVEKNGVENFLKQIQDELVHKSINPCGAEKENPERRGHQGPRSFHSSHS